LVKISTNGSNDYQTHWLRFPPTGVVTIKDIGPTGMIE